ncbi:alpha/beta fold hydrolase [Chloroflexota bacterium]
MNKDNENQQIVLKDGRALGYTEYGNKEGKPLFFFHGFPGSRFDWNYFDEERTVVDKLNIRVITPDRPGMGLSDHKRGRKILDWPNDVVELADALKLDRFAILGISGGGPYASACAYKIPERIIKTAIISGMGPSEAPGIKDGTAWIFPGKNAVMRRLMLMLTAMGIRKQPDRIQSQITDSLKGPDKELFLKNPGIAEIVTKSWGEAFCAGIAGVNHDATLYTHPWRFRLQDINTEVFLWHGDQDYNVPISVGRYVAEAIPNCKATFVENEGHFSLAYQYLEECLNTLI